MISYLLSENWFWEELEGKSNLSTRFEYWTFLVRFLGNFPANSFFTYSEHLGAKRIGRLRSWIQDEFGYCLGTPPNQGRAKRKPCIFHLIVQEEVDGNLIFLITSLPDTIHARQRFLIILI